MTYLLLAASLTPTPELSRAHDYFKKFLKSDLSIYTNSCKFENMQTKFHDDWSSSIRVKCNKQNYFCIYNNIKLGFPNPQLVTHLKQSYLLQNRPLSWHLFLIYRLFSIQHNSINRFHSQYHITDFPLHRITEV